MRRGSLYARPRLPGAVFGVGIEAEELVEEVDGVADVVLVEVGVVLVGVLVGSEELVVGALVRGGGRGLVMVAGAGIVVV